MLLTSVVVVVVVVETAVVTEVTMLRMTFPESVVVSVCRSRVTPVRIEGARAAGVLAGLEILNEQAGAQRHSRLR